MANDNFTVGRDCQAVLIAPNGTRFDLSKVTDFSHTAEHKTATSSPLNSPKQERFLPDGHRLKFSLDRRDGTNEAIFAAIEAGWWAFGSIDPGTSSNGAAYIYINEADGSQTTHQFRGLTIKSNGLGDFRGDQPVKQTIEAHAMYGNKV
jgi:hypothetical protein